MTYNEMINLAGKYHLIAEVVDTYNGLERLDPGNPDNTLIALEEWDVL